ncbi:retinoic acid receptor RXR [Elysia marginata]|uniref:Retinoic acid receptor RXR n=1 Tax=Elysia marginata TaxID=1093978 RepID=A0AAV4EVX7_9GAST|nr:retinoic acid receptor RXR [Elysia marginata]
MEENFKKRTAAAPVLEEETSFIDHDVSDTSNGASQKPVAAVSVLEEETSFIEHNGSDASSGASQEPAAAAPVLEEETSFIEHNVSYASNGASHKPAAAAPVLEEETSFIDHDVGDLFDGARAEVPVFQRDSFFDALYSAAFEVFCLPGSKHSAIKHLHTTPACRRHVKSPQNPRVPLSKSRNPISQQVQSRVGPSTAVNPGRNRIPEEVPPRILRPSLSHEVASRIPSLTLPGILTSSSECPTHRHHGSSSSSSGQSSTMSVVVSLCAVCGDWTTKKYYGVFSCKSCRAFFHRTISRNLTYKPCKRKTCMMRRVKRRSCRYCRYTKCLSVGMKRDSESQTRLNFNPSVTESGRPILKPICELIAIDLNGDFQVPWSNVYGEEEWEVALFYAKHLYELIQWTRHIPYYEKLSFKDKLTLIQNSWQEFLISSICYRSVFMRKEKVLRVTNSSKLDHRTAFRFGIGPFFDEIYDLVESMRELRINEMEMGFIQVLILFSPAKPRVVSVKEVTMYQEKYCEAFEQYVRLMYPDEIGRIFNLFTIQSKIHRLASESQNNVTFFELIKNLPFDAFLMEFMH